MALARRLLAEALGSLMLSGTVIGSGILAERLAHGEAAIALIGNTGATGAILFVLVSGLGPISGAHFNPAVSLVMALRGELSIASLLCYAPVQIAGCVGGAVLAHAMFELPLIQASTHARAGYGQVLSEAVATFALVLAILTVARWRAQAVAGAVALAITAGYWWTASTSFANPAITIARTLTDTFAGVRAQDAPGFIAGQFAGALAAWGVGAMLAPARGA
jgi:glycerol uptake facilitator-like aquaporin